MIHHTPFNYMQSIFISGDSTTFCVGATNSTKASVQFLSFCRTSSIDTILCDSSVNIGMYEQHVDDAVVSTYREHYIRNHFSRSSSQKAASRLRTAASS